MSPGHVYFVGAGPGAPDLLTLRGRDVLARAGLVVYADSLVDARVAAYAPPDAEVVGSAALTLEEVVTRMVAAARAGKTVVRLHSGDPSLFSAVHEQTVRLDDAEVPWTIVPGVSSLSAAAAGLGIELTVPGVAQTVILTRIAGRAGPVPAPEDLSDLARHRATLVLFLSVGHIARVAEALLAGGYPPETAVAVVHRASWPDESAIETRLDALAAAVRAAGWKRQALIVVGPALARGAHAAQRSRLYDAGHPHVFRPARRPKASASRTEPSATRGEAEGRA